MVVIGAKEDEALSFLQFSFEHHGVDTCTGKARVRQAVVLAQGSTYVT